jgi:hypothetical protein
MYAFASGTLDIENLRERLSKMTDGQLRRFGEAARYMCSPKANMGQPPRQNFVIQLEEARIIWGWGKLAKCLNSLYHWSN